jgi:phenylalanyl-tRNA synthetase beta chain
LYEFGKVYTQQEGKYIEQVQLAIWLSGNVRAAGWKQKAEKADLFYLKSVIAGLVQTSGIKNIQLSYDEQDGNTAVTWKWKNQLLCTAYEVPAKRLNEFEVKQDVYFAAVNWDLWQQAMGAGKIVYSEVPKFPAVQRDLAIVIDRSVKYEEVRKVTEQLKLQPMQSFDVFDVFESEKLGADKKSYALSYTFQLQDRTLTDAEIDALMKQLVQAYTTKLQAQIRE